MQNRTRYIVGNWKMNGDYGLALATIAALRALGPVAGVVPVICPPFPLLHAFAELLGMGHAALGAQDCSSYTNGAHTGEVSAEILAEQNCRYVILGHSERRHAGETDAEISAKIQRAHEADLIPIICVGETSDQRQHENPVAIVGQQIWGALENVGRKDIIIAYEPVWAIGTGNIPTIDNIADMHRAIREHIAAIEWPDAPILYGGSVKLANAAEILATPGVDGLLIGGASLVPEQFISIAKQAGNLA